MKGGDPIGFLQAGEKKKVILVCTDLGGFGGRMIIREVTEKGENQGQIVAGG